MRQIHALEGFNCCPLNSFCFASLIATRCWEVPGEDKKVIELAKKELKLKFCHLWIYKHIARIANIWPILLFHKLEL